MLAWHTVYTTSISKLFFLCGVASIVNQTCQTRQQKSRCFAMHATCQPVKINEKRQKNDILGNKMRGA